MIGVSYVIDAGILLLYAYAGTIPTMIGPAYAIAGLALMAFGHPDFGARHQRALQGSLSGRAAVGRQHGDHAGVHLRRAAGRRDVPLHPLHRVQFLVAARDAGTDRDGLDRDGVRPRRAVPADRQADRDAARQSSGTLCDHAGVHPDHRPLHVPRHLLGLDEAVAVPERAKAERSLQAHRGARRARRTDRLVQPPLHHAHAGRGNRARAAAAARPARSR